MSQSHNNESDLPDSLTPKAYAVDFSELDLSRLPDVGGKNASLGELIRSLQQEGVRVPGGFAVTTQAFRDHLDQGGIADAIYKRLDELDVRDVTALANAGQAIRRMVESVPLPEDVVRDVVESYRNLSAASGEEATDVAVRSSATAEDLPTASFAGQQETYLNVRGASALQNAVRACMASLFTDRAIVYRHEQGIAHREVSLSVGVQKMVRSDLGSAGVIFTLDTESGFRNVVLITGAWGLGEFVVQGRVNPDEFVVHKPTALAGSDSIIRKELGDKRVQLVYAAGGRTVKEDRVPSEKRRTFVLTDDEVMQLARWAIRIEEHYSKRAGRPTPMDLEWARDGRTGELFILQARPETVHAQVQTPAVELYKLKTAGRVLLEGKSVGAKIGYGPVRIIHSTKDLDQFQDGEVLVVEMTDPDWEPILKRAAAVVTDEGGRTCHAAIVSRELGIPCVVASGVGTEVLQNGQDVTVCCAEGEVGRVYEGRLDFECQSVDVEALPESRVPLMLNIANPQNAFRLAQLPSAGVGLMRMEFLVSNWIGIHPMALVNPDRVSDAETRAEIRRRTVGHEDPTAFFVERLSLGVAQIAAAFYPRPVILRMSDFKTNEYANLLGGAPFEPTEANPMIGFRGASRYYDERYRDGFALECAAVNRVRKGMGLTNLKVMIPFCRTLEEGRRVLGEMAKHGLKRGQDGLEIWVMCEIPNNVMLAEEFSELFDGFSIGSNDLTQLTLGIDRDSKLLTELFDERDLGVKRMIETVVTSAHRCGRKVGICGQAPSDYPEFAEWLASIGIDSMSLNPDSLAAVTQRLGVPDV